MSRVPGRVYCCIPGCRRSWRREQSGEGKPLEVGLVMCRRHWKSVDPALRERHKAAKRAFATPLRRRCWWAAWPSRAAARRAVVALSCAETCAWIACVMDARIKAALGVEP